MPSEAICDDGKDNDCNGNSDCADVNCRNLTCGPYGKRCNASSACVCVVRDGGVSQTSETLCDDGKDNDCDDLFDCADSTCEGGACGPNGRVCLSGACTCSGGGSPEPTERSCGDGKDNDCDGQVDCLDPDCNCTNYGIEASTHAFVDACLLGGMQFLRNCDDAVTPWMPIGFPFNFYYQPVDRYALSSNGMILLTQGDAGVARYIPSTCSGPDPLDGQGAVFLVSADLCVGICGSNNSPDGGACTLGGVGNICSVVEGVAPNRELIVTFKGMSSFDYTGVSLTYTAYLHEADGTIDVVFATMNGPAGGRSGLVGIQDRAAMTTATYSCGTPIDAGVKVRFVP